jgi:hypothetical protein
MQCQQMLSRMIMLKNLFLRYDSLDLLEVFFLIVQGFDVVCQKSMSALVRAGFPIGPHCHFFL